MLLPSLRQSLRSRFLDLSVLFSCMPPKVGYCFGFSFSVPLSNLKEIGEFRYFPLNISQLLSETVYSLGKYQTHLFPLTCFVGGGRPRMLDIITEKEKKKNR